MGLVKRYPRRLMEPACAQAVRENGRSHKSIQNLTERLLATAPAEIDAPIQGEPDLAQQRSLIRDGNDYADLFTLDADTSGAIPPTKKHTHHEHD